MELTLIKSFTFLFVIFAAYILKKKGIFSFKDYKPLSKLTFYLTTPCLIISGFRKFVFEPSLFLSLIFGLIINIIIILVVLLVTKKESKELRALYIMTAPTFNIGTMVLPFAIGIFPAESLSYLFMFDIGNAIMCTGLIYALAKNCLNEQFKINIIDFLKSLFLSLPFTTYLILLIISLISIDIPSFVFDVAEMIGNASVIVVMFMLGLMLEISLEKDDVIDIIKIFSVRYFVILIISVLVVFFFPANIIGRKIIVLCMLAPITSLTPIFCSKLNLKSSIYSFVSSVSMPLSIVLIMLYITIFL